MAPHECDPFHRVKAAVASCLAALALFGSACLFSKSQTPGQKASASLKLGLAAENAGNYTAAIADYNAVIKANPGTADETYAYYDLGTVYQIDLKNIPQAKPSTAPRLALDPNYVSALFNLAVAQTPASPIEAASLYQQIINVDTNYAAAYLNLGFVQKTLNDVAAGNANIRKACAIIPLHLGCVQNRDVDDNRSGKDRNNVEYRENDNLDLSGTRYRRVCDRLTRALRSRCTPSG